MKLFSKSILLACCFASTFLTACSDGAIGMRESRAWHQTASTEVKRDYFAEECEAFGYKKGTTEMNACIERRWTESNNKSKEAFSSSMESSSTWDTGTYSNNNSAESSYDRYVTERMERDLKRACRSSGGYWSSISKRCR